MTVTTAIIVNAILGIGVICAVALVVRLAHLLPEPRATLYRTHGLPFRARRDEAEESKLARAA